MRIVGIDPLRQPEHVAEQDVGQRRPKYHDVRHEKQLLYDVSRARPQQSRKAGDVHQQHEQPCGDADGGDDLRKNALAAEAGQRLKRSPRIDFVTQQDAFERGGGAKALGFVDLNALLDDGLQHALVQLRRITCGAEGGGVLALVRLHQAADAVVDDLYRAVAEQHDVFGLDVAVDDAVTVQRRQAVADLAEDLFGGLDVIQPLGERCAVDEFAQADANAVLRAHIIYLHQIALPDAAQRRQNREVRRRRDPPDHHLPVDIAAHQIDAFVQVRDKSKIP